MPETCNVREVLTNLTHWQDKSVVMTTVRIGMGSIRQTDLSILVQDVQLLLQLGLTVCFALNPDDQKLRQSLSQVPCGQLRVNNRQEAMARALELNAQRICLLGGGDRIHTRTLGNLDDVSAETAQYIIETEADLSPEAKEALELAVLACSLGIPRVHFVNVHHRGALLQELFTNSGAGVMVYNEQASPYRRIRQASAGDVLSIIRLLPNRPEFSSTTVSKHIAEFAVYEVDSQLCGCAWLHPVEGNTEIRWLTHGKKSQPSEILQQLLGFATERARETGSAKLFVPTDELPPLMAISPWFSRRGFHKETLHGSQARWTLKL